MTTGFADINGTRFFYENTGTGHPLVLIHAGVADSRMWQPQIAAFTKRYNVIRYDLRGFGQTPVGEGEFSDHDDLRALLDHLGIERAYLMGCSLGGAMALDFTLTYPEKVPALITVCSSPSGMASVGWKPRQYDALVAAAEVLDLERICELEVEMWVDGPQRTPDQVDPTIRKLVYDMNLIALNNEESRDEGYQALENAAIDRLGEIHVPTLVISGDLDQPKPIHAADVLAAQIKAAKEVVINGTAHLPNLEKPAEFNQIVLDFLDGPQ